MAFSIPKLSLVAGAERTLLCCRSPSVRTHVKVIKVEPSRTTWPFQPLRRGSGSSGSGDGHEGRRKHWWSMSFESKIITSLLFGAGSFSLTSYYDTKQAKRKQQLELVTRQIRNLYGPLYGNRLVQQTSYRAVVGESKNLKAYLQKAEAERNGEMIQKWRRFVYNVLYPLDREAQELISKNAHLVATDEFPEEFKLFLTHFARQQFVMEEWMNGDKLESTDDFTDEDYLEETNASGQQGLGRMLRHVEDTCRELRIRQRRLIVEVNADESQQQHIAGALNIGK